MLNLLSTLARRAASRLRTGARRATDVSGRRGANGSRRSPLDGARKQPIMASPITRITELFKRALGREEPAPAPNPALASDAEPVDATPKPVAKTVS